MRSEDIRAFRRRKPFQPFRLILTDGRTYDVHHPELVMIGCTEVAVGFPSPGDPEPIFDRFTTVSLLDIMRVEPLEALTTTPR